MDLLLKRPRRKKLVFLLFSLFFWRVRGEINEFLPHPPKKEGVEEGQVKNRTEQKEILQDFRAGEEGGGRKNKRGCDNWKKKKKRERRKRKKENEKV